MTSIPVDLSAPALAEPLASAVPRAEYPRPDLDRSARWASLNGPWRFEAEGETREIVVPFAWETPASGIGRTWLEHATYVRDVVAPEEWTDARVVLCFGAVHHRAIVRVDGVVAGEHVGGYESFEMDVTGMLRPGVSAAVSIEVFAPADKRDIPHGKQRSIPRDDYDGVSFTPTSGIWQSVWLEGRGRTYPRSVALRGDSLTGFDVTVDLAGDSPANAAVRLRVMETGEEVRGVSDAEGRMRARLPLSEPRLWSPATPHLYRVEVAVDDVTEAVATAGLRRIEARGEQLFLNNERLYLRGVLDQGYWPRSGLTAPTADDLRRDVELARELGYNLVRKHLKFEEPLWLHEADRTGVLVWAEPACPSRFSPAAAEAFERQLEGMVQRDGSHPSIVVWGLYNEEWGLDWDIPGSPARAAAAVHAYEALRALDDTRPIVENSGWSHVRSDIVDWHYYEPSIARWKEAVAALASGTEDSFAVRLGPDFIVDKSLYASVDFPRTGVPIVNSEYGEGFTSLERAWHLRWETQELRRHDRFAGYVYTEFADVEHEAAGLLAHDRTPKDWGGCLPSDVNADTTLVLDLVPLAAGADIEPPSEPFTVDVHVSHHGAEAVEGSIRVSWVPAGAPVVTAVTAGTTSEPVRAEPFILSPVVSVRVPAIDGPARLVLSFVDGTGAVRARAFLDAAEVETANRRGARAGEFEGWSQPGYSDAAAI